MVERAFDLEMFLEDIRQSTLYSLDETVESESLSPDDREVVRLARVHIEQLHSALEAVDHLLRRIESGVEQTKAMAEASTSPGYSEALDGIAVRYDLVAKEFRDAIAGALTD